MTPPGSAELRGRSTGAHGGLGADPTRRGCWGEGMAKGFVWVPPRFPLCFPGSSAPSLALELPPCSRFVSPRGAGR